MPARLTTVPVGDSAELITRIEDISSVIKIAILDAAAKGITGPDELIKHLEPVLSRAADVAQGTAML
jgi:hypothetical protein